MAWMIGVDVGGTFTDFFAFDDTADQIVLHKVASTPANPAQAVIAGLRELSARHGIDLDTVTRLSHGTTVATNAPLVGFRAILSVFAAAVVGGLGSIPGAVVGGFAIGLAEELSLLALPATYKSVVGFLAIALILTLRPQGLLGARA